MSEKAQFCHHALIDQIDQWQKSLEEDFKILKLIKQRVISTEEMLMMDRVQVNTNVANLIEAISKEFQTYRNERNQIMKGSSEFLSIIKKYETLSANFTKINQDIRHIYSYSQEYHNLKQEETKKQFNNEFLTLRKQQQEIDHFNNKFTSTSPADGFKQWQSEKLYQRNQDKYEQEGEEEEEGEEEQEQQQLKNPQSQASFLNDTFNSMQNKQISQQQIEDIKQRSQKQTKSYTNLQQSQPSKSILKEKKMIDFADNIKSEWFGQLQKTYQLPPHQLETKNCSVKTCQTTKFQSKENPNLSQIMSRSKTPVHKRSYSSQTRKQDKQKVQQSQLNYSFRQKQEESNASAFYILKRELLRMKELVSEQQHHFDNHHHNNIDEEIKKYKLENTLMKTQCQILKDENQELLVEFQKTKKILEDQMMLSKELQDKLIEQRSIRYSSQYDSDDQEQYENQYYYEKEQNNNHHNQQGDMPKKYNYFTSQQTDTDQHIKSTNRIINQQISDNLNEEMLSDWVKQRISKQNNNRNQESMSDDY